MSDDPVPPAPSENPGPTGPGHPTGRVALIFTDIQGSTGLWEKLGDRFAPVLELHNRLMREAIETNRGFEVKTVGDAFMVAFQDPADAVRFAIDALESFDAMAWPASVGELLVRIGVHTGDPIVDVDPRNGRVDYFGPMVNLSARIESAAHGGQILVGQSTRDAVEGQLEGVEFADMGEHRLKGIDSPERIYQVLSRRLPPREFPPISTLTSLPTNLPYQLTTFVGREREIGELGTLLADSPARLVTLSGPGGTGKTRLSVRVGNVLLDKFPGGVWFANLARARTSEDVAAAVAEALGMPTGATGGVAPTAAPAVGSSMAVPATGSVSMSAPTSDAGERLIANVLEYRKPLLLILDNFEQVARFAPGTVGLWLRRAPKVKFLVTSQTLLGLAGEHEYRLGSLGAPPRAEDRALLAAPSEQPVATGVASAASYDAVRLFVERAREAAPGFALSDLNAADIMTICAEVEGIPLAIELAAARVKILSPAQIVERLGQKFQLLRSSRRDLPERHQTLRAAIEWSFELLGDWEKACFQQTCVFRGGFSLEAAEGVIDLSVFPDAPLAMDAVQMLREKSFLASRETPFGVRYHMFRAMREFGEANLRLDEEVVARHAAHFAAEAKKWDALRVGPRMVEALDRLDAMRENALAAIERTLALGRLESAADLALAIAGLLHARGTSRQRLGVPEAVLAAARAAPGRVGAEPMLRLGSVLARAYESLGQYQRAEACAAAALEEAQRDGVPPGRAMAESLTMLAEARRQSGKLDEALNLHDQAEAMCATAKDDLGLARNLGARAMIQITRGDRPGALASLERAEKINRAAHNTTGLIANLSNHARVLRDAGDVPGAVERFTEAERLCRSIGDAGTCARVLGNRANTLVVAGDITSASRDHAEAERIFRELGDVANAARVAMNRGEIHLREGQHAEALAVADRVMPVMDELGQRRTVAAILVNRARALLGLGRAAEALDSSEQALATFLALGVANSPDAILAMDARARALAALHGPTDARTREAATVALRALEAHGTNQRLTGPGGVDVAALRELAGNLP